MEPWSDSMRVVKGLLHRAAEVLEFMAAAGAPCRLSELAEALGLPKSAVHRLLHELCTLGWVEQQGVEGPYRLTLRFALLGNRVLQASGLPDAVAPVLRALAERTGELARVTVASGEGLAWLASAQGAPPGLVYQPAMEGRLVLHATANGKAFLAALGERQALMLARRGGLGRVRPTPRTIATVAELVAALARVRAEGYATALEEAEQGVTAVAVAIRPSRGGGVPLGTLSVAGPSVRMAAERIMVLAGLLGESAAALGAVWPEGVAVPARVAPGVVR